MRTVHIAPWLKSALHASSHPCMCTCVLRCGCFLLACLCSLLRPTVLLPALPDVHLSVQREVQVQHPVRLPLGDRGHIRLRDTPHRNWMQGGALSFQTLEKKIPLTQLCEKAIFQHLVIVGKKYKIRPEVKTDGEKLLFCAENM